MNVKLSFSVSGLSPGSYLIVTWATTTNPGVEVGRISIPDPSTGVFTAEGLLPVMYIFKFYQSNDGVALDTVIAEPLLIDASLTTEESVLIAHYKVGDGTEETNPDLPYWKTPDADSQTLIDERFAGATYENLTVEMQGIGRLNPEQFEIIPSGGINLLGDGFVFQQGNYVSLEWHVSKTVSAPPPTASQREPIYIVGVDQPFVPASMFGKNIAAYTAASVLTITFGEFGLIPDGYSVFSTYNNPGRYLSLVFSANTIWFMGALRDKILLAQNERIVIQWVDQVGYVVEYSGNYHLAGSYHWGMWAMQNYFLVNQGHWDVSVPEYPAADFIRMYEALPSELKTTYANYDQMQEITLYKIVDGVDVKYQYYPNRGKFGYRTDSGTGAIYFKFPSIGGLYQKFIKGTGELNTFTQGAGSIGFQQLLEHAHRVQQSAGGNNAKALSTNSGIAGRDNAVGWAEYANIMQETGGSKNETERINGYLLIHL